MDRVAIPGKEKIPRTECVNYNEIQNPRKGKGIIDFDRLMELLGFENYKNIFMGSTHRQAQDL